MNRHSMIKLFKTPQKSVNINASKLFNRIPNGSVGKPRIFKKQVTHSNLNRISHLYKIYDNAGKELRNSSRKLIHIELNIVRPKDKKKAREEANKSKNNAINKYQKARKAYVEFARRVLYPTQIQPTGNNYLTIAEKRSIKKMAQKLVAKRSKLPNNVINKIFGYTR